MAELEQKKQEKIHELTDRISKSIIDHTADFEDDLKDHQMFAAIIFAVYCTISSLMEYYKPGHPEAWYEECSYNCIIKMLTDYRSSIVSYNCATELLTKLRSSIVDNPQEKESNK